MFYIPSSLCNLCIKLCIHVVVCNCRQQKKSSLLLILTVSTAAVLCTVLFVSADVTHNFTLVGSMLKCALGLPLDM